MNAQITQVPAPHWWVIAGIVSAIVYRIYQVCRDRRIARRKALESHREWKRQIQGRLDALDKGEFSRVNNLHKLAQKEIDGYKESKALSEKALERASNAERSIDRIYSLIKKSNNKLQSK